MRVGRYLGCEISYFFSETYCLVFVVMLLKEDLKHAMAILITIAVTQNKTYELVQEMLTQLCIKTANVPVGASYLVYVDIRVAKKLSDNTLYLSRALQA